jgi:hypothetical protein
MEAIVAMRINNGIITAGTITTTEVIVTNRNTTAACTDSGHLLNSCHIIQLQKWDLILNAHNWLPAPKYS